MRKNNRKLGMQALENRNLMAGDIAVSLVDGDLFIQEAPGDIGESQQVEIYQLSSGRVRIQGLGDTDIQTQGSFNGVPITFYRNYVDVSFSDDLFVDLGGGSDQLYMRNYNGGVKADLVDIDMDGSGRDDDLVSISGLSTRGELKIDTGAGADQVSVSGSTIGNSGWEDLEIDTGSGADHVSVSTTKVEDDVDIDMYTHASEADVDKLTIDNVIADDIFADLGNGDDDVVVRFSTIADDIDLDVGYDYANYGQDEDYVFLGFNNVGDDIRIEGGDSDDVVRAAFNTADDVHFDGESGTDRFYAWFSSPGQDSNNFDTLDLDSALYLTYGSV